MEKYEANFADELRQSIQQLDRPKRQLTTREVIESMQDELHRKRQEGWSFEELARVLTEKGLKITATTLRDYLGNSKKRRGRSKRGNLVDNKRSKERADMEQGVKVPVVTTSPPMKADVIPVPGGFQRNHAGFNEDN